MTSRDDLMRVVVYDGTCVSQCIVNRIVLPLELHSNICHHPCAGFLRKVYGILTTQLVLTLVICVALRGLPAVTNIIQTRCGEEWIS